MKWIIQFIIVLIITQSFVGCDGIEGIHEYQFKNLEYIDNDKYKVTLLIDDLSIKKQEINVKLRLESRLLLIPSLNSQCDFEKEYALKTEKFLKTLLNDKLTNITIKIHKITLFDKEVQGIIYINGKNLVTDILEPFGLAKPRFTSRIKVREKWCDYGENK